MAKSTTATNNVNLNIRLPYNLRDAFAVACDKHGTKPSKMVRRLMEEFVRDMGVEIEVVHQEKKLTLL